VLVCSSTEEGWVEQQCVQVHVCVCCAVRCKFVARCWWSTWGGGDVHCEHGLMLSGRGRRTVGALRVSRVWQGTVGGHKLSKKWLWRPCRGEELVRPQWARFCGQHTFICSTKRGGKRKSWAPVCYAGIALSVRLAAVGPPHRTLC